MSTPCPACGELVDDGEKFCEACGQPLPSAAEVPPPADVAQVPEVPEPPAAPEPPAGLPVASCARCGGVIADDGFCSQCGEPAASPRDHFSETPADWVAGVCDRGISHPRNEDAMALGVFGSVAALVVCDGVTTAPHSDVASLAAAQAAMAELADRLATEPIDATSALIAAGLSANTAVVRSAGGAEGRDAPSCTFVAAILDGTRLTAAWNGDSRVYWLPDAGTPAQVSVDHSWAQEMMALGLPREQAEAGPQAHAITRWLGVDAPEPAPTTSTLEVEGAGWLLVCSDGLWNYCSDAAALAALIADSGVTEPLALADHLVRWANEQGGHDNITVALARRTIA